MFDQLESVKEEGRQGVTMDERGGGLMLVSPRPLDRIGLDGLPAIVTQAGELPHQDFPLGGCSGYA
jgi:hypothetical protein